MHRLRGEVAAKSSNRSKGKCNNEEVSITATEAAAETAVTEMQQHQKVLSTSGELILFSHQPFYCLNSTT